MTKIKVDNQLNYAFDHFLKGMGHYIEGDDDRCYYRLPYWFCPTKEEGIYEIFHENEQLPKDLEYSLNFKPDITIIKEDEK